MYDLDLYLYNHTQERNPDQDEGNNQDEECNGCVAKNYTHDTPNHLGHYLYVNKVATVVNSELPSYKLRNYNHFATMCSKDLFRSLKRRSKYQDVSFSFNHIICKTKYDMKGKAANNARN